MSDRQQIKHLLSSARSAFKINDLDTTEESARKILQIDGQHQDALRLLGRVLNRKSQWHDAFPYWQKLAKLDPTRAEYQFQAGRLATRIEQEEIALAYLQQTLTLAADHEKALILQAKTHQKLQQWAEAFDSWYTLYTINPRENDLEKRLTVCARKIDNPECKKKAYQRLLNINPEHLEALRFLAPHYTKSQNWQEAHHFWVKLHKLSSLKAEDWYLWEQAATYAAPGQLVDIWQTILLYAPKDASVLKKIAKYHFQHEEWQSAKRYLDLLVKIHPEDIDLCRLWANATEHTKTGNSDVAWKRLYELAPQDHAALQHLAKTAYARKQWADSIQYWGKLCDLFPDTAEYWDHWAHSHVRNKTKDLHHIWEKVLEHCPQNEEYWIHWANAHLKSKTQAPDHIWEKVLRHCPKNEQALRYLATQATQLRQWENAYSLWSRLCSLPDTRVTDIRNWARAAEKKQKTTSWKAWQRLLEHHPEDLEALKQLARHATAQEKWQESAHYWARYNDISEHDESCWIQWARAASKVSPQERFNIWQQVHSHFPHNIEALKHLARQTWEAEDWLASADYWGKLYALNQDENNLLSQARALTKGNAPQASQVWSHILGRTPDAPEALRNLARLKALDKSWHDAICLWDRLLKQTPHDPWVLVQKGRALKQIDDDSALEHHWQYILSLFPDHIEGLATLGRLATKQRNWEIARRYWDRLHKLDPTKVEPPLQIARSYIAQDQNASAEKYLRLVLQQDPHHTEALTGLVRLFRQQEREHEILQLCREWKTARPHDIRPRLLLARSLTAQSNDKADIIQAWQDVLEIDARNLEGLISLARLHQANSAYPEAEIYWQKVCQSDKKNTSAWTNRIRILDKTDRPDDIPALLKQVEEIFDDSLEGLCATAEAYEAARYFESAEERWRKAAHRATDQVGPKEEYADFLLRQGKISDALQAYHNARELDPYSINIANALIHITRTLKACGHDAGAYLKQTPNLPAMRTPEIFYPVIRHKTMERGLPDLRSTKRLKVMLITGSLGPGGAERQLVQTACAMKQAHDRVEKVTVLVNSLSGTPTSSFFLHHLEEAGVELIEYGATVPTPLPEFETPAEQKDAHLLSLFPRIRREALLRLYHVFRQARPDVVHAWQDTTAIDATTAASLAGVPRILISTRSLRPDHHRRLLPYLRPAYRELLQLPQVQLSNNSLAGLKDYAAWLDLDLDETLVTPNGIDTHKLRTNCTDKAVCDLRQQLHIPDGAPIVGGIMRFTEEKRPLLWIGAMISVAQQIAGAHFILVGDGPMHPQAQDLVAEHNLEQRIHLVKNTRNIAPWYGLMDLLVLTSRLEGCPNVLLESQSLGVPVITLDVGGAGETVLEGQTGRIVCAKTEGLEERLSQQVIRNLNDPVWLQQAKEKAPRFVDQNFSLSSALNKTLEAFNFRRR